MGMCTPITVCQRRGLRCAYAHRVPMAECDEHVIRRARFGRAPLPAFENWILARPLTKCGQVTKCGQGFLNDEILLGRAKKPNQRTVNFTRPWPPHVTPGAQRRAAHSAR